MLRKILNDEWCNTKQSNARDMPSKQKVGRVHIRAYWYLWWNCINSSAPESSQIVIRYIHTFLVSWKCIVDQQKYLCRLATQCACQVGVYGIGLGHINWLNMFSIANEVSLAEIIQFVQPNMPYFWRLRLILADQYRITISRYVTPYQSKEYNRFSQWKPCKN